MSHPRITRGVAALAARAPWVWISVCSVLVKIAADGCDATLWSCAMVFGHATKLLLPCLASTLVFRRVSSVSREYCKKRRARYIAPTGK
jgi:hypothetical protein